MKRSHKKYVERTFDWLKIGGLAKFRKPAFISNLDEYIIDTGIAYWITYPPPDIDGNHFGLHGPHIEKKLYEQICLITDKATYPYAIPGLKAETLIQVAVDEKIIWVKIYDLFPLE